MTDAEVHEWLAISSKRLVEYPPEVVEQACFEAQGECTHYSHITPAVVKRCEAAHAKALRFEGLKDRWQSPLPALPKPELSEDEFERIIAERGRALSSALDEGIIIRTETGFERA